ncbi:HAD family hydrolase [Streptosporangium roseum]|uniref:Beta-phosphoglucomutase n=1 Tax=Streptosporangium roseum (strain ATCC 12428 / DSM 43021 / JCM 3005 / KCTC 9067 / NCIMB 10171 / NRRL 2505 / NI 9100) TaxID=479432 RepID=D2B5A9_STRRD|nr:beta-phosphoglucomutase family hydrolase [Streptosporangium roseum]ACZ87633.1 beta-phosphoglucomutase family hydrolase [Streptosporangium roseum DSM 43021]
MAPSAVVDLERTAAMIFDTDGVITDTARVHAAAWKRVFDTFLRERAERSGERFRPFDTGEDYLRHVDGKSRADGVRGFLDSRGIAADPGTVADLASRKDASFLAEIHEYGVVPFPATAELVGELRRRGVRTAAVSASRNCAEVLRAAGVTDLFDIRVDGVDAVRLGLAGKPDPALFLQAARQLAVKPGEAAVVEDSLAGVQAARAGRFGVVIGVDRRGNGGSLRAAGADLVVADLAQLHLHGRRREPLAPHL